MILVTMLISGCEVDRAGLLADAEEATHFDVRPPVICPGEPVTVQWLVPNPWEGCPGRFGSCSTLDNLSSRPVNLFSSLTGYGLWGDTVVFPPDDTWFDFQGTVCDERGCLDPIVRSRWVNVLHEGHGVVQGIFPGTCNRGPAHRPFWLNLSPCSRIVGICLTTRDPIILRASGAPETTLFPGSCTENFNHLNAPGAEFWARTMMALDPTEFCGDGMTSARPRPSTISVDIIIECVPEREGCGGGSTTAALISVPCGDGICNTEYEDSFNCPADCGGSEEIFVIEDEPPTPTPTGTPTSTPASPIMRSRKNANCRRGPSTAYGVVTSFLEGQELQLEGRNADNSWWWALLPESTAHCWVADSVVAVDGPVLELPVVAAPPLPTASRTPTPTPTPTLKPPKPKPSPPAAPTKLAISSRICGDQGYSVTLRWKDNAGNEDGYRVYRDAQLIATLKANITKYTDIPPGSGPYTYSVEAFNAAGVSSRPSVHEEGCLY